MKNVVITGATGAIGIALINLLIQKDIHILAICRPNSINRNRIPTHPLVDVIECELSRLDDIHYGLNKFDAFFHFAWDGTFGENRNNVYVQQQNIKYTLDAVNLAYRLGCRIFIGSGSQAEYGRINGKMTPETPVNPENGYGIAKYCAGKLSALYAKQLGMSHIWTRILSVYGPYDNPNTLVIYTIRQLLNGLVPKLTKGEQMWDYLYSEDAANALFLLAEKGKAGLVYCLGSGVARPLSEFIYMIRDAINPNLEVGIGQLDYAPNQVMYLCADISKLTEDTGFIPQVDFKDGINKTIEWYRRYNANEKD